MVTATDYHVNRAVINNINDFGFHNGVYRQWMYKKIILLEVFIDVESLEWSYQVVDVCHDSLYSAYYDQEYGRNEIAKGITNSVDDVVNKMIQNKILIKDEE